MPSARQVLKRAAGFEPAMLDLQSSALDQLGYARSGKDKARDEDRTRASAVPGLRSDQKLSYADEQDGTGEGPRTLDTRLEVSGVAIYTTPALEKKNPRQDLNPYLIRSKRTALPLSYGGLESVEHRTGFEPVSRHWQRRVFDRARPTMQTKWSEWEDLNLRELVPRTSASASRLHSVKKT